jgi:hypothetical protein
MIITADNGADAANKRFGRFHDGILKRVAVTSGNHYATRLPWEPPRTFASNEEELNAAGGRILDTFDISVWVNHHNYDWPNQPYNRMIVIKASDARDILPEIISFAGIFIFDLKLEAGDGLVKCVLTYHEPGKETGRRPAIQTLENGVKKNLLSAKRIRVMER